MSNPLIEGPSFFSVRNSTDLARETIRAASESEAGRILYLTLRKIAELEEPEANLESAKNLAKNALARVNPNVLT